MDQVGLPFGLGLLGQRFSVAYSLYGKKLSKRSVLSSNSQDIMDRVRIQAVRVRTNMSNFSGDVQTLGSGRSSCFLLLLEAGLALISLLIISERVPDLDRAVDVASAKKSRAEKGWWERKRYWG